MIVRLTPAARAQLLSAAAYVHADRPSSALEFRKRVDSALRRLIAFPQSGRAIPEFNTLGSREVLVDSYRLFYRVKDDVVWVVGVWHDAQIPDEPAETDGV